MLAVASRRGQKTRLLGRELERYRLNLGKRNSLDVVVERLQALGIRTEKSQLSKYEKVRPPHIGLLKGLASVYGADFCALCDLMADELNGRPIVSLPTAPLSPEALDVARLFDAPDADSFRALVRSVRQHLQRT